MIGSYKKIKGRLNIFKALKILSQVKIKAK